jgi:ribose 5-phosphate isomerase A
MQRDDSDKIYKTDNGGYLLDLYLDGIDDPETLERELLTVPGVVDSGLFIGLADFVICGSSDGSVVTYTRS